MVVDAVGMTACMGRLFPFLGSSWLESGARDVPVGLGSRELGPLAVNPDTQLSRGSQSQGSGGQRYGGGWLWVSSKGIFKHFYGSL